MTFSPPSAAVRAIRLLQLFLLRGRLSSSEAARALGVTVRRARTDLQLLSEHAPITPSGRGRDRVWVLDPGSDLGHLGVLDRVSLQLGRDVASFLEGTSLHGGLSRAENDARGPLPTRYAQHFDRKFRHLQEPARRYAGQVEVVDTLLDALLRERTLSLTYRKAASIRRFDALRPLTLVIYRRALYLLAQDSAAPAVRRLAVDWMSDAVVGAPFQYPEDWDPDRELASAFGMAATGEAARVVLRFSASMRRYLVVRRWHPSAELVDLPDGRLELRMHTRGAELVRFCLEWGANVEVVEPGWLREAVVAELQGALGGYGEA